MATFVNFNGNIYISTQVPVSFNNRGYKYGDSIFETIRANGHHPIAFSLHYKRMIKAMLSIQMDISSLPRIEEMETMITRLLQKNKHYSASRIRIQVTRSGEGLYTPQKNTIDFLIEATPLSSSIFELNPKGLLVSVYTQMKKAYSPISFFKNGNALLYVLAAINKDTDKVDDCLLLNDKNRIIEACSSNLFWIQKGVIFTPSVFTGCVDGVMRQQLIEIIKTKTPHQLIETQGATDTDLLEADEIFLTNAIQGIQWVVGFRDKRYFNQTSKILITKMNEHCF
jgi:branched-chain amino acid aminotransferase